MWVAFVVVSLLALDVFDLTVFGWVAPLAALLLVGLQRRRRPRGVTWIA